MMMLVKRFRSAMSLALMLALATVFSFRSFAASEAVEGAGTATLDAASAPTIPAGMLSGSGRITVNGNAARPGATVLSGSTVATGPDSFASLDLGSLGQITLQPNTSIVLTMLAGVVQVSLSRDGAITQSLPGGVKGQVRVEAQPARLSVERGTLEVRTPNGDQMLKAGEGNQFNSVSEAIVSGDSAYTLVTGAQDDEPENDPNASAPRYVTAGVVGVAILTGVAGALAVGVMLGSNDKGAIIELPRPSEVVP